MYKSSKLLKHFISGYLSQTKGLGQVKKKRRRVPVDPAKTKEKSKKGEPVANELWDEFWKPGLGSKRAFPL